MSFVLFDTMSAMPAYYSLKSIEGVPSGPTGYWQSNTNDALQFVRKEDAEDFIKYFVRHVPNIVAKEV